MFFGHCCHRYHHHNYHHYFNHYYWYFIPSYAQNVAFDVREKEDQVAQILFLRDMYLGDIYGK